MGWSVEHTVTAESATEDDKMEEILIESSDDGSVRLNVGGHGLCYEPRKARVRVILDRRQAKRLAYLILAEAK